MTKPDKTRTPAAVKQAPCVTDTRWGKPRKLIVSILLSLHVAAVFVPPFAFAARGLGEVSPVAAGLVRVFGPYYSLMYLDHGYFFFAPNPGPSYLIRYECRFDDGRPPLVHTFPDLQRHRPRLLYHRHFMLSEQLNAGFVPAEPPVDVAGRAIPTEAPEYQQWQTRRDFYTRQWDSFRQHLKAKYDADEVVMTRVEHTQPSPFAFLNDRIPLDHPSLYRDLTESLSEPGPNSAEGAAP